MKDPTIQEMREAVKSLRLVALLLSVNESPEAENLSVGLEMARRYLAMMEEGPVGWGLNRDLYAHPTTTHTEED